MENASWQNKIRQQVWQQLRQVARPDSRFHWDFDKFIPDYAGSDRCAEQVLSLSRLGSIFVTPDNNLAALRVLLMRQQSQFIATTYGITRGFVVLDPARVPLEQVELAATLDGMEHYARPVTLKELACEPPLSLLVTGASAVTHYGLRMGKGHGFFDLEWAMLCEIGLITPQTLVVAVAHDCQVIEQDFPPDPHDTIVDYIVTPSRTLKVNSTYPKPAGLFWEKISQDLLDTIPPLQELWSQKQEHHPQSNLEN